MFVCGFLYLWSLRTRTRITNTVKAHRVSSLARSLTFRVYMIFLRFYFIYTFLLLFLHSLFSLCFFLFVPVFVVCLVSMLFFASTLCPVAARKVEINKNDLKTTTSTKTTTTTTANSTTKPTATRRQMAMNEILLDEKLIWCVHISEWAFAAKQQPKPNNSLNFRI